MKRILCLAPLLALAACVQPPTEQEELELERGLRQYGYRVVRVIDGNTLLIDLNDQGVERKVRLIGVSAASLVPEDTPFQMTLFQGAQGHHPGWEKVDGVVDEISRKFGSGSPFGATGWRCFRCSQSPVAAWTMRSQTMRSTKARSP